MRRCASTPPRLHPAAGSTAATAALGSTCPLTATRCMHHACTQVGTTDNIEEGQWVMLAIDGGPKQINDFNGFLVEEMVCVCVDC